MAKSDLTKSPFWGDYGRFGLMDAKDMRPLLENGEDPNTGGVLTFAIREGSKQKVDVLLKFGADATVYEDDSTKNTLVHLCASMSNYRDAKKYGRIVGELVRHGADINAVNKKGQTALHIARNPDMTKALLDLGASTLHGNRDTLLDYKGPFVRVLLADALRVHMVEQSRKELLDSVEGFETAWSPASRRDGPVQSTFQEQVLTQNTRKQRRLM